MRDCDIRLVVLKKCRKWGVSVKALQAGSRKARVVRARYEIVEYLSRKIPFSRIQPWVGRKSAIHQRDIDGRGNRWLE